PGSGGGIVTAIGSDHPLYATYTETAGPTASDPAMRLGQKMIARIRKVILVHLGAGIEIPSQIFEAVSIMISAPKKLGGPEARMRASELDQLLRVGCHDDLLHGDVPIEPVCTGIEVECVVVAALRAEKLRTARDHQCSSGQQ